MPFILIILFMIYDFLPAMLHALCFLLFIVKADEAVP